MRIKKLSHSNSAKNLQTTKKTAEKEPEIKDKFTESTETESPKKSVKKWISENSGPDRVISKEKKGFLKSNLTSIGLGTAGIIAASVFTGAAGAGVVGGIAGYSIGQMNESGSESKEVWKKHDINNPEKLTGWSYSTSEYGHQEPHYYTAYESVSHSQNNSDGTTYTYYTQEPVTKVYYTYEHDGYYHNYSANIDWRKVGEFETPHFSHDNPIGPLAGAGIGLAAGALGGGIVEGVSSLVANTTPTFMELGTLSGPTVAICAAVGGAIGAAAGYLAGKNQEDKNVVITRTYPVPEEENKYMGEIPDDWTQNDWSGIDFGADYSPDTSPDGMTSVYRTAPVLDSEGKPVMQDKTETLESKKYGKAAGAAIGTAVGTIAGALAGVALQFI